MWNNHSVTVQKTKRDFFTLVLQFKIISGTYKDLKSHLPIMKVDNDDSLIGPRGLNDGKSKKDLRQIELSKIGMGVNDSLLHENGQRTLVKLSTGLSSQSSSVKPRLRAVLKNGDCNIFPTKVPKGRFIRDIFTTLVDIRWRWIFALLTAGFFGSWFLFGVGWWLIALYHGDLEENHLPWNQAASNWTPCVMEVYGFKSCFLFSVETQHTTGYGQRTPTEECPMATILMCIQNIAGLIIEAFLIGIVFAKMTRPKLRTQTLRFSKCAVIHKRDDVLCLMFRVGDMRTKSRIIEAKIKAQLIRPKRTKEGHLLGNFLTKLVISADECEGDLFFVWPMTVVHKIDEKSPFYRMSATDLHQEIFEIVVTLEGTIESTDQKTQARSSYLSNEVIWGHRFESVLLPDVGRLGYRIDYGNFDKTVAVDSPVCSAIELAARQAEMSKGTNVGIKP